MALEELFKNVTKRFNDDAPEEHEPVFKCPRCQQTTPESKFQELNNEGLAGQTLRHRGQISGRRGLWSSRGTYELF